MERTLKYLLSLGFPVKNILLNFVSNIYSYVMHVKQGKHSDRSMRHVFKKIIDSNMLKSYRQYFI